MQPALGGTNAQASAFFNSAGREGTSRTGIFAPRGLERETNSTDPLIFPALPATPRGPGSLFQASNQVLQRPPLRQPATAGSHISPLRMRLRIASAEA